MKVVILAGGLGTRISEESHLKPKPMIEIGDKPILWHIMKTYSSYGINEFIICCGYKGNIIKEYFLNSFKVESVKREKDFIEMIIIQKSTEPWNIILVDTGESTMTGGRLKRVKKYVGNNTFCLTYGDTLNNVNIKNLISFHKKKNLLATVTACRPPEKYGVLILKNDKVIEFKEKPVRDDWVNGGYFVMESKVFDLIDDDATVWEKEPMNKLVKNSQINAYMHTDFYQSMDTISDKNYLNKLWKSNNATWKIWE
jgi:glucose-1-phosphate cytidylyltransferase